MGTREEVVGLYASGYTCREIESMPGMPSRETVMRWARAAGVARPRGRRRRERGMGTDWGTDWMPEVVGDGPIYPDIDPEDKDAIIDRLLLENAILRGTHEVLKGRALGCSTNREKSLLIDWLRAETGRPLRELTASLRISKSSYEHWHHKALDPAPDRRGPVADEVERVFREEGRCARGYRFVHARLAEELGRPVSEKVVREAMGRRGLRPVYLRRGRRYSSYAGEIDDAPANLPLRGDGTHDFSPASPNALWASDITEFRLPCGAKVYLSPVVDLFDSRPVAWAIGARPTAALANESLSRACAALRPGEAPVVHTDRGCHYRWPGWKSICGEHGLTRSMSRKGRCADNAAMEGFFGRMKNEFFRGRDWSGAPVGEFVRRLDRWMGWYRSGRLREFREGGAVVWDTIDGRRARLGLAV